MKLVIQPKIQIGALEFSIVFNQKILDITGDKGQSNVEEQKIRLDKELPPEHTFVTLVHEIEHIAEGLMGYNTNETVVTSRSHFLAQAILSMGVEPDFSRIPEEDK